MSFPTPEIDPELLKASDIVEVGKTADVFTLPDSEVKDRYIQAGIDMLRSKQAKHAAAVQELKQVEEEHARKFDPAALAEIEKQLQADTDEMNKASAEYVALKDSGALQEAERRLAELKIKKRKLKRSVRSITAALKAAGDTDIPPPPVLEGDSDYGDSDEERVRPSADSFRGYASFGGSGAYRGSGADRHPQACRDSGVFEDFGSFGNAFDRAIAAADGDFGDPCGSFGGSAGAFGGFDQAVEAAAGSTGASGTSQGLSTLDSISDKSADAFRVYFDTLMLCIRSQLASQNDTARSGLFSIQADDLYEECQAGDVPPEVWYTWVLERLSRELD